MQRIQWKKPHKIPLQRESPLDNNEIKPVNLKGNQPWILVGRSDAEAEDPVFWSSDANSWFIGKIPAAGKECGQKEKRVSEDEMAGKHHEWKGHEPGQTLIDGEGQGGLACCNPWGSKQLDRTGWLNNNPFIILYITLCMLYECNHFLPAVQKPRPFGQKHLWNLRPLSLWVLDSNVYKVPRTQWNVPAESMKQYSRKQHFPEGQ